MAESAPLELTGTMPLQRQASFQSNILFIQQEHAKTLQDLHLEIQRLQKRCSELTFSLAMGTTSSPQEDFYREKAETTQKELEEKIKELQESAATLEKKDKRINTLEQQLRAQEKKYQDLLKNKDQQLRQFKLELAEKSKANAELMHQRLSQSQENATVFRLTKMGVALDQDLSASAPSPSSPHSPRDSNSSGSPVPQKLPIAPHPPREGSGHRIRRRTSPRAIVTEGEPALSAKVRPRAPSGRVLRRVSTPEGVPDPAPFLQRPDDVSQEVCPTSTTKFEKPLPPIARHTRSSKEGVARSTIVPQPVKSQAFLAKHKAIQKHKATAATGEHSSGSSSPEVEVLAVDTVIKRNHKLRRAQEYNAD